MFPLQQGNDPLFLEISSERSNTPQDLVLPTTLTAPPTPATHGNSTSTIPAAAAGGQTWLWRDPPLSPPTAAGGGGQTWLWRKPPLSPSTTTALAKAKSMEAKLMHRDAERRRREELSTLHATLRSLLPLQFIKDKRTLSDQIDAAAGYIKHLEWKLKELNVKRSELNTPAYGDDARFSGGQTGTLSKQYSEHSSAEVRRCFGGKMEIILEAAERSSSLTRVLKMCLAEGITVVNCVSATVNRKWIHTLLVEVEDPSRLNIGALQQKLIDSAS